MRMAERRGAPLVMVHMLDGPVDRSEARRYFDSHRRDWKEVRISVGASFHEAALTWGFKSQETPEINAGSHAANSGFVHIFDRLAIVLADSNHEKLNGVHRCALGAGEAVDIFDVYHKAFEGDGVGIRAVYRQKTNAMIGKCGLWWRVKAGVYMLLYMLFEDWWGPHWRSGAGFGTKSFRPAQALGAVRRSYD